MAASVSTFDPAGALQLTDIWPGSDTAKCLITPLPRLDACLLPPNTHRLTVHFSPWVQFIWRSCAISADSFLRTSSSPVPRPRGPSPQVHGYTFSRLTWLGGLLDNHPYRFAGDPLLLISHNDDHPGAVNRSLRSGTEPPIIIVPYRPPGHLLLKDIGPALRLHPICAPGLPARINFSRPHEAD